MANHHTTVAEPWGPRWLHAIATALTLVYLGTLAVNNTGITINKHIPRVPRFFMQSACLFPRAARMSIDYRAAAWSCDTEEWVDIDHRPYFPIHAENKESRFHRVGHFYRRHTSVLGALETYLVDRHNRRWISDPSPGASTPSSLIGGIQLYSLRTPFPEPGEPAPRWRWRTLSEYPDKQHKRWYHRSEKQAAARCSTWEKSGR